MKIARLLIASGALLLGAAPFLGGCSSAGSSDETIVYECVICRATSNTPGEHCGLPMKRKDAWPR